MSALTAVPRNALRLGLSVAGIPARMAGGVPAYDRLDATIRDTAGRLIGDRQLLDEAQAKRVAAQERDRAVALREDAAERDIGARERASERKRDADRRASQRKQAAERTAGRKAQAAEDRARRERAAALAEKDQALAKREEALKHADEADRLADAAAAAKAARKR